MQILLSSKFLVSRIFRYLNLKKAGLLLPSAMMLASVRVVCDWSCFMWSATIMLNLTIKIRILKSIS